MQLKLGTVAVEPITLAEAKAWLKVDYADEDSMITKLITAVRHQSELFTGLSLAARTIEYFDNEIADEIVLPYPDHLAIVEVKINDVISTAYKKTGLTQFIIIPETTFLSGENNQGIYIKYTTSGVMPEGIDTEMLKIIDEKYRNRGNTFEGSITELNENAYANLAKYCLM